MEQVVEHSNMHSAYNRVRQNHGAPGIDGMTVQSLRPYLNEHWEHIRQELLGGTYRPRPVRRVEIPKPDGGQRLLGIPTVVDRLLQQALLQILTPIFNPGFSEMSFGFRPGRKAQQAVEQARRYITEGYDYVVDIDLEKFFDRVNHDIVMARIARRIKDKRVLRLVRAYLQAGIMLDGVCVSAREGTPQGGPLSPLLANIILDDLDKEMEKRGHRFVRYADDCNIYVRSRRAGERVMASVSSYLERVLKLKVNRHKSAVDRPWQRKFLGFTFLREPKSRIMISPRAISRVREKIRELTRRSKGISMVERIRHLNAYLRGWFSYYSYAELNNQFAALDGWTRRRLRACMLAVWKMPSTRRRELMALGISERKAKMIAGSRKGCWVLSRTPQLNQALGKVYWQRQGSISLEQLHSVIRRVS
jgi:group II intron reverse transcriptase/maturase